MAQFWALINVLKMLLDGVKTVWGLFKQWQYQKAKDENKAAIEDSAKMGDQRPIEEAIGSGKAGKPSGIEGTEIRDSLPGVKNEKP